MHYRRAQQLGACYFFTLVTYQRQPLLIENNIDRLHLTFKHEMQKRPFSIDAIVILPDHLHTLWQHPEQDSNYSLRWSNIKRFFSTGCEHSSVVISNSHLKKREKNVWQRRWGNRPYLINAIGKIIWIMNNSRGLKLHDSLNGGLSKGGTTCPTSTQYQKGTSYIEVMVVVVILAIVATVTLPNLSSVDPKKLDLAASEIAESLRFARIEAMRTGTNHGVTFSTLSNNVKVYRFPSLFPIYDIYHPVDKKLYTLNLKTDAITEGVELQSYDIYFSNSSLTTSYIGFNAYGNPKSSFFGTDYMLDSANITISYAGQTRIINVSPMTGRVTVQ